MTIRQTLALLFGGIGLATLSSCSSGCKVERPKGSPLGTLIGKGYCNLVRTGLIGGRPNYRWTQEDLDHRFSSSKKISCSHLVKLEGIDEEKKMCVTVRIHRPREEWNDRILWYFHGGCANGDFVNDLSGKQTLKIFDRFEKGKPIVITVSLGNFRLIDPEGMGQFLETMDDAFKIALPKSTDPKLVRHWVLGISMGGLNGLQVIMADECELNFERVVIVAPYIPRCDPFDSAGCESCLAAKDDFGLGRGEKKSLLKFSLTGIRSYFSKNEWREKNPIEYARRGGFRGWEDRVMVVWGKGDVFGFDVTSRQLFEAGGFRKKMEGGWKHEMPPQCEKLREIAAFLEGAIPAPRAR